MTAFVAVACGVLFGCSMGIQSGLVPELLADRTVKHGLRAGLNAAAGIAAADAIYAFGGSFLLFCIGELSLPYTGVMRLLAGLYLGWLGLKLLLFPFKRSAGSNENKPGPGNLLSSASFTLAHPLPLMTFIALSSTMGSEIGSSLLLPAGIVTGSLISRLAIVFLLCRSGTPLPAPQSKRLNRRAAQIVLLFSLYGIMSGIIHI